MSFLTTAKMNFLSPQTLNNGRQLEADLAKFVCLVGMVIVHCFDVFVSFSQTSSSVQYLFLFVLNSIFGAGTFMFCMGLGIAYSKNNSPGALMRRGVRIFVLGYVLNLLCAASYLLLLKDLALFVTYALGLDILQFAGLALFLFGLLKKLDIPDGALGALAVVLSLIGTFAREIDLGNPLANIFCGLFIGTFDYEWMTGGIFPLCNWFIFVVAGYLFATHLLLRCTDKNRLYRLLSGLSALVLAVYLLIALPRGLGMMGSILRFHQIEIQEAVVCLAGALFALGVYHALGKVLPQKVQHLVVSVSKNINPIYCIQWVVLAWAVSCWVLGGKPVFSDALIMVIALVIFVLSATLAQLYRQGKSRRRASNS